MLAGSVIAATGPAAATTTNPGPFAEMLASVPAGVLAMDGSVITYVDMDLIWQRVGIGADPAERAAFEPLGSLPLVVQPELIQYGGFNRADELRQEIGFDGYEIRRAVNAGVPPREFEIVEAAVGDAAVLDAIQTDPEWSADLREVDSDSGRYFQWTDDPVAIDPARRTVLRQLGQGGALAIIAADPARLVRANDPAVVEAALATTNGATASAIDDPALGSAFDSLGSVEVTQAMMLPRATLFDPIGALGGPIVTDPGAALETARKQSVLVEPYLGLMIVEIVDGESVRTEILMIHLDTDGAEGNVDRVEAHVTTATLVAGEDASELFEGAEVEADGSIVRVVVPGEDSFGRMIRLATQQALLPT